MKTAVPFSNVRQSTQLLEANADGESTLPAGNQSSYIGLASFYLNSDRYVKGTLQVKGPETYEVYVNNENKQPPTERFPCHWNLIVTKSLSNI